MLLFKIELDPKSTFTDKLILLVLIITLFTLQLADSAKAHN